MSSKRITVSTVGYQIVKKLADDNIKVNLAVSLHSANNIKEVKLWMLIISIADDLKIH